MEGDTLVPRFCLILSYIGLLSTLGLAQTIQELPSVQTVTNGDRVVLNCVISAVNTESLVEWTHEDVNGVSELISLAGTLVRPHNGAYNLEVIEEGTAINWRLTIGQLYSLRDAGQWTCQLLVGGNTFSEESTLLQVLAPPDVVRVTGDLTPEVGSDVSLECVATGTPAPSVVWARSYPQPYLLLNGTRKGFVKGSLSNTLQLSQVNSDHRGEYVCIISNSAGSNRGQEPLSRTAYLQLPYMPEVKATLPMIRVMEGREAVLACISQAFPPTSSSSSVMWLKDGQDVGNNVDYDVDVLQHPDNFHGERYFSRLTISNTNSQHTGSYECRFTNSEGTASGTVSLGLEPTIDPNFGAMP